MDYLRRLLELQWRAILHQITAMFTRTILLINALASCIAGSMPSQGSASKPNILFIFTDDQDLELGSMQYLPSVRERIQGRGFTFENHYATVALCCPSRVALLRGQHAHNTNNTYVMAPGGGYDKFRLSGEDKDYLPHWLRKAGYRSEYIGKLMNQYGVYNYNYTPAGWDHFDGLLDPYTYIFNTPVFSANGQRPVYYAKHHQTDVIRAKAVDRLNYLLSSPQSWYLQVAPVAPHQQFNNSGRWPPVPATRHSQLYPGLKAPRTPNFNPAHQDKPSWLATLPVMNDTQIQFSDDTWRARAQALAGIDEMVTNLLDKIEAAGQLNNTIIIFSTDHGYHVGQHRIPAGKTLPYREDTHVPFFISGPGIRHGKTLAPSTHVDIATTILSLAGLQKSAWPAFLDGRDLSTDWRGNPVPSEVINIEFWGAAVPEGALTINNGINNSYKTIRIVGQDYGYLYSHWCTNETELYDTTADPYEMNRLSLSANPRLASRLNGLLLVTKTCAQDSCREPWKTLHPDGSVCSLKAALNEKYDAYYSSLPKVSFNQCLAFQSPENEKPFFPGFDATSPLAWARMYRNATDALKVRLDSPATIPEEGHFGDQYVGLAEIEKDARVLTDAEINGGQALRARGTEFHGY